MPPRLLQVSTANAAYQRIEVLKRNRAKRHRYGEFVVEGVRAINGALAEAWTIRSFAFAKGRQLSRWATTILEESGADSHFEMDPALFDELSDKQEASELLAVVAMRPDTTGRITPQSNMIVVVIDRPASPGNLGTIIRSCDAFGASGVIVTGHGVDIYDPATIRASVGSFFAMPVVALESHRDVDAWVKELHRSYPTLRIIGASEDASSSLHGYSWPSEVILVVGNETRGLSRAYRELCDHVVSIPMQGTATSLNAAVATSILLYEFGAHRDRHASHERMSDAAR